MTLWGAYSNSSYDFRSALNPSKIDVFKKLYYISNNQIIWADSIPTTTNDDHMGILGDNALDLAVDEER